ncbi:RING/FYVE/PHD zinc finger protein [Cucumis melo var. makuwa]|uniref:RING/FYVE/PHD zinc finger protein n=1 Tax=Cucumis melo var. makuwa TaxID=1194695 RepID=A0A5A7SSS6_CUCMM|nr:RING/FYVE/PHD zinc finger protein [Cucumis melo var. makuwa]
MSDHLVLYVDNFIPPAAPLQPLSHPLHPLPREPLPDSPAPTPGPSSSTATPHDRTLEPDAPNEDDPLILVAECRICQEEDSLSNLETPCACSGSLKYAHRKCVQHWCNEKGDITCEICHQFGLVSILLWNNVRPPILFQYSRRNKRKN